MIKLMKVNKSCLYVSFMLLLLPDLNAQLKIKGGVFDNDSLAIEYATIALVDTISNEVIAGTISEEDGHFYLNVKQKKNLIIQISHVGYESFSRVVNSSIDLGRIHLNRLNNLNEIVVVGRKKLFEKKVDRLVFNIENSSVAAGGDAVDALKITPRIRLYNNQISIVGKSEMGLMVEDKFIKLSGDDLMNFLQSIPLDNIKSIEVITTPPAKYDAEGNSGLINIKMKKSVSDHMSTRLQSFIEQSTHLKGGLRGSFNYKKKNLSTTTYLNYTNGSYAPSNESTYFYSNQLWEENEKQRNFTDLISGRFTLKYQASSKWTVGAQITSGNNKPLVKNNILTKITNINSGTDSIISTINRVDSKSQYILGNVFSDFDLGSQNNKLSVNFDYFKYDVDKDNDFQSTTLTKEKTPLDGTFFAQKQLSEQDIENYSTSIDLELPYDAVEMTFGMKFSSTETNNINDFFTFSNDISEYELSQSDEFCYEEKNYALHASAYIPIADKWESQVGLRYENLRTKGTSLSESQVTKNTYSEFYPSIYLSYFPNDDNVLSIDYSRRISKPKFAAVNPFRKYKNKYSYYEGNPFLKPQFIQNIELNHIYRNNFSSSIYYSFTRDGSSVITLLNANTQIRESRPLNYFKLHQVGLSESYTTTIGNLLEITSILDIYWNKTVSEFKEVVPDFEGWGADIGLYNTIKLNKSLKASLYLDYSFPNTYIDSENKSVFSSDLNIKYNFLKNRAYLNFTLADLFRSNKQKFTTINNDVESSHEYYSDAQKVKLTLTYILGNKKIKSSNRKTGNKEENKRAQ